MAQKQKTDKEIVVSTTGGAAAAARRKSAPTRTKATARTRSVVPVEAAAEPVVVAAEPTYEQIAALAYTYWEERGYQGGSQEEDWLRAEQELRTR